MSKTVYIKRRVLFGDCDPQGIVYAPRFSYFALEAVHESFDTWLGGRGVKTLLGFDLLPPVRAMSVEFFQPVAWDDELTLKVEVSRIGDKSMSFTVIGSVIDDLPAFLANITLVCICPRNKTPILVSEKLRTLLV